MVLNKLNLPQDQEIEPAPVIRERYLADLVEIQPLHLSEQSGGKIFKSIIQILGKASTASRVNIRTNFRDEEVLRRRQSSLLLILDKLLGNNIDNQSRPEGYFDSQQQSNWNRRR